MLLTYHPISFETFTLPKTLQELRMLSRSLSDCQSLTLNAMIQVLQSAASQVFH